MADASRPLTASGCLAGDPAAAELRNQAMPGAAGTIRPGQPCPHPRRVITGGHDDVP
jgi:hypothetical protein